MLWTKPGVCCWRPFCTFCSHKCNPKSPSFLVQIVVIWKFMKANTLGRVRKVWTTTSYTSVRRIFLTTYQEISIAKSSEVYVNTNCKWLPRSTSLGPVLINIISLGQKLMYGENALFWDLKGSEKVKKTVKMDGFFKNCHYLRVLLLINQIKKIGWYAL